MYQFITKIITRNAFSGKSHQIWSICQQKLVVDIETNVLVDIQPEMSKMAVNNNISG